MIDLLEAAKAGRWDEVRQYFEENDYLTTCEMAIKIGRSPSTIRNWRRKAGLSKAFPFKTRPQVTKREYTKEPNKEIWDTEEWFREQYETNQHGVAMIAKIIDRSPRLVSLRLEKYGIETRSHGEAVRSTNPCSSAEWLLYWYGTREEYCKGTESPDKEGGKGWSLKRCAKEAGVVPATIYNWLVRANKDGCSINIRDLNESLAGKRNPFYGKKHTKETKERLRQTSRAYFKSRAAKSTKKAEEEQPDKTSGI